ncbi:MAG: hypothetical protein NC112_07140 [Oxalobacter formigenes]|nr:hypothetical protein [Oxalobacter formigenes]
MSTTTITTTPNNFPMQPAFPMPFPMPGMPNQDQMNVIGELGKMIQGGRNPLQEMASMQEKIAQLEKQLSEKSSKEIGSIDKQLMATPQGAMYLNIRRDGIMEILTRYALRNPDTAAETKAFLDGWQAKASEYLKGLEKVDDEE